LHAPPDGSNVCNAAVLNQLLCQLDVLVQECKIVAQRPAVVGSEPRTPAEPDCVEAATAELRHAGSHVRAAISAFRAAQSDAGGSMNSAASMGNSSNAAEASPAHSVEKAVAHPCCEVLPRLRRRESYRLQLTKKEKEAWCMFNTSQDFDFFHDLLIARDGGFSEVNQLWYPFRWISAIFIVGLMISNLSVIVFWDWKMITHRDALREPWTFNQVIMRGVWSFLHLPGAYPLDGSATICYIELIILALIISRLCQLLLKALTAKEESVKWKAIETIFWKTIPELSTYSAMRLLHFASPSVIAADFMKFVTYSQSRWKDRPCLLACKWTKFVVTRCLCLILGMDAYLVKLTAFEGNLHYAEEGVTRKQLLRQVMFLVQILGIVQLDIFVRARLFTFIFGGEDSILQPHEKTLKAVWEAMLARAIWKEHSCLRFLAIMLSFSDVDFQKLVLNERSSNDPEAPQQEFVAGTSEDSASRSDEGVDASVQSPSDHRS